MKINHGIYEINLTKESIEQLIINKFLKDAICAIYVADSLKIPQLIRPTKENGSDLT